MREWTDDEVRWVDRLILEERQNYGHALPVEDCLPEGWCAVLEANESYRKVAGCCGFETYLRRCIRQAFEELRRRRNERIRVESGRSLDQRFDEDGETMGDLYYPAVGDGLKTVDLWNYVRQQGALKGKITYLRYCGYIESEIVERIHLPPDMYRTLMGEIQDALTEWQAS